MIEHLFAHVDGPVIKIGSVGYDDEDEYCDLGTTDNDGHTLVKVQLFEGRDHTKPLNPKRAQGYKIICHLNSTIARIPPKDTVVYVIIPNGMEQTPGAGVIVATIEKTHTTTLQKDRVVMDYGDQHVVIRGKSVAIQSTENEFVSVGEPRSGGTSGVTIQAKDGSGAVFQEGVCSMFVAQSGDAKVVLQMTPSKFEVLKKVSLVASSIFRMDGSDFSLSAPGNGFIMPATLVLGVVGAGTPPYALAGTLGKISGCVHISTDT